MTENLPAGRPDFEPPDRGRAPQPAGLAPASAPATAARPGVPPRPAPEADALPPGPYKQPSAEPAPYPPVREARGSVLLGMGISLVTLGVAWAVTIGAGLGVEPRAFTNGALSFSSVVLIVLGVLLAVIPRTMRTGAGVLVGFTLAMLVAAAVWVSVVLRLVS